MKRVLFVLMILLFALSFVACTGKGEPESVDFDFDLPESFDVDSLFPTEGKEGIVTYRDGSTGTFSLTKDNIVGFDTSTTGEKTARLVYKGAEKTFSYVVTYAANPTKEILTSARVSIQEAASLNGATVALRLTVGDLVGVQAVSFTIECNRSFGSTLEITPIIEGWDVRIKEYSSSAKVVAFRRGGMAISADADFLQVSVVGYKDAVFSVKEVVLTDGTKEYDLPNAK